MPPRTDRELIYADAVQFMICTNPKCNRLHIVLEQDGQPVAVGTAELKDIPRMVKLLQDAAYSAAVLKDKL